MIRTAVIALSACLLTTGLAQAAGGGQQGDSMNNVFVQSVNIPPPSHSAVVPGIDPPSGDKPTAADIQMSRGHSDTGGGSPAVGDPANGITQPIGNRRGHFALACEVKANGDIVLANIGDETLAGGARIKWSALGRLGYFALNRDLPAGAHATASDVLEAAKRAPCLAAVL